MTGSPGFKALIGKRYLSLETRRKNGIAVRTPVWFAASADDPDTLYVDSRPDAGKVKRLRADGRARIAPCGVAGRITGSWIDARATIAAGPAATAGMALLDRKYWPWKRIGDMFTRLRSRPPSAVIAIRPA